MKFRNPWIDPRILQLRLRDVQAYLLRWNWKLLGPAANPLPLTYEGPANVQDARCVLVPVEVDHGPLLQRLIDVVADLAQLEDRYAGDVFSDMLQEVASSPLSANGPGAPVATEPATK